MRSLSVDRVAERAAYFQKNKEAIAKRRAERRATNEQFRLAENEAARRLRALNPQKHKEATLRWIENNKEKYTDRNLIKNFGITYDDYIRLLSEQDNVCAICKHEETRKSHGKVCRLAVDHCHKTGKVRGLLCARCNVSLGAFRDRIDLLQESINYLNRYQK